METKTRKRSYNPYILVILSFLLVIFIGSFLLCMPWTQRSGNWGNYMDALVTAVSATCVTGFNTYKEGVANTLTFGGQLVLLILIQIGGLGFITLLTFIITLFKSKLQFKNRYLISQMVNSTSLADVVKFVRRIIAISAIVELIGFGLGIPVFLEMFPNDIPRTIWYSLFHSVSAFNNAGFDLFNGTGSFVGGLIPPVLNGVSTGVAIGKDSFFYYYFCSYIMVLIVFGGLSFIVILDIFNFRKNHHQWRALTKIILLTSFSLIFGGALLLFLTDGLKGSNSMSVFDCLFQSVTCRTAGFATYSQDAISLPGRVICCCLMFVGGSPLSTAGGIKTTTIFLIILAMINYFSGKKLHAFKRSYSNQMVIKAMSLIFVSIFVILLGYIGFSGFGLVGADETITQMGLSNAYAYELFSAFGTVGLATGIEPYLSVGSKIVLCLLMFLGRLGPMTFFQVFQSNISKKENTKFEYVEEDFLIG